MNSTIPLGPVQIAWACLMMFAMLGLSLWQRLGLIRPAVIAAVRTVAQLTLVGFVIGWVFKQNVWYIILGVMIVMTILAGQAAVGRVRYRMRGLPVLFTATLAVTTSVTLLYVTRAVLGVDHWDPRYLIPLGGIILGNAMTASSLAAERLLAETERQRREIEAFLALGASANQAIEGQMRAAFRAAMTPTLNQMAIVGVVTLPGIMTGQMLGGQVPIQASLYQIVIMFMLVFANALASVIILATLRRRLFTRALQLRPLVPIRSGS